MELKRRKEAAGHQVGTCRGERPYTDSPPSYAQVVSPPPHGVKRSTSDRVGLSPVDCCPKRSFRVGVNSLESKLDHTPPSATLYSGVSDNETPDSSALHSKGAKGAIPRRLFTSPSTGQLTSSESSR